MLAKKYRLAVQHRLPCQRAGCRFISGAVVTSLYCHNHLISLTMLDTRVNPLCVSTSSDVRFGNGAITPKRIEALEARVNRDSSNSSRPPSTDSPAKKRQRR